MSDKKFTSKHEITITVNDFGKPLMKVTKVINQFGCLVVHFAGKEWTIATDDPKNFYELGLNITEKLNTIW